MAFDLSVWMIHLNEGIYSIYFDIIVLVLTEVRDVSVLLETWNLLAVRVKEVTEVVFFYLDLCKLPVDLRKVHLTIN
jgi:hypothetical protein